MTAALEVDGLSVAIAARGHDTTAIDNVSFQIGPGEILGVVGESGAGKSLTGTAVLGLLERPVRQTAGRILLDGERIDTLDEEAMRRLRGRRIGAVFQDPLTSLNPLKTIGSQLVQTIRTHLPVGVEEARARALRLVEEVGIPAPRERLEAYPHALSGGMRQRVVLALAFACEPMLVIADEPTTALDVSVQAQIIALLKRMCKERRTAVMLITHDMGVIAECADRIVVLYAGRIAEIGHVDQVLDAPVHPYTAGLMASIPTMRRSEGDLPQIRGSMPRPGRLPTGCAFHPRCHLAEDRCARERPEPALWRAVQVACWRPGETNQSATMRDGVAYVR